MLGDSDIQYVLVTMCKRRFSAHASCNH